eukprot:s2710_g4.t1
MICWPFSLTNCRLPCLKSILSWNNFERNSMLRRRQNCPRYRNLNSRRLQRRWHGISRPSISWWRCEAGTTNRVAESTSKAPDAARLLL